MAKILYKEFIIKISNNRSDLRLIRKKPILNHFINYLKMYKQKTMGQ